GKIPGGFFKREGRLSEKEILLSRLIDRPIRPLFPDGFFNDTQVIEMLISADLSVDMDGMGIIGASAALISSTIPFTKPVGAVKIGWKDGQFFINPGKEAADESDMVLFVAGTEDDVVMIESGGNEFSEDTFKEGLKIAKEIITDICVSQKALMNPDKLKVTPDVELENIYKDLKEKYFDGFRDGIFSVVKSERKEKLGKLTEEIMNGNDDDSKNGKYKSAIHRLEYEVFRKTLISEKKRNDGRDLDEIRDISIELGILPRVHGSAVFTRGETQALATVTLGSEDDAQRIDDISSSGQLKKFMLHYNFPPFSTGEARFMRGPGRREIGHGFLAERALLPVLPPEDSFPYTIRLVSDILESNGSSSMASVCAGSLCLMDAGVPTSEPVAGVGIGLVKEGDRTFILTDIQGLEDRFGDMDFKVAGTRSGITALQLDVKISGLSLEILKEALERAKEGRNFILGEMEKTIKSPRDQLSRYAPHITILALPQDKIGDVIGPGGRVIKGIIKETGAEVDIDDMEGKVTVSSADDESTKKAV
ncbi:MAG: polyribonucleotide nucleotidyltransferase, partial [Candidatus Aminicenantes bacterium]|nr:polyribonucleotide nucleotidyltransferase [Candidatus Aminicenantes bacterium]